METLRQQFAFAVGSDDANIRINTDSADDALLTMTEVCKKYGWELRVWDHHAGMQWFNGKPPADDKQKPGGPTGLNVEGGLVDPIAMLDAFLAEPPRPDPGKEGSTQTTIVVVRNGHLLFESRR